MSRFCFVLVALACAALAQPKIGFEEIASPAPVSAEVLGPSLALSPEGIAWLSWLEKKGAAFALRSATFDAAAKKWNSPRPIASGANVSANDADFPALTVGPAGRATAVWLADNRALTSRTTDAGQTWSAPEPLTRESDAVEFVSLATLADGRVLAAWLDGRAQKADPAKPQQLRSRILGADGPDTLVDASVCECCQTALTAFHDGSALLAYRGRNAEEVRDIRVTRFRHGVWDQTRPLNNDDWRINGCPVNGPQLASDGGRVGTAWFTAADNDPRVLASFSPDAGARFLLPLRIDHVKPAGRVSTQLLHDGALLVSWVDADGALWLNRITPDFAPAERVPLAPPVLSAPNGAKHGRVKGFPRTALLRDYDGGKNEAQVLVAFRQETTPKLRTLLVHIPEGDLLDAGKNCDCAPTSEELRGFPIRGTVIETTAVDGVRVAHAELPGLMEAGTRDFKIAPELAPRLPRGRQFLGRVERRQGSWWLFDVRLLAMPQP